MKTDIAAANTPRSILLIRLSSFGDIILCSALPRLLRRRFPDSTIHMLVGAAGVDLYRYSPYVDGVSAYDRARDASSTADDIRAAMNGNTPQIILDLQNNRRSKKVRKQLGGEIYTIDKHRLGKLALVWRGARRAKNLPPVPQRYLDAAAQLDVPDDGDGLEIWLPEDRANGVYRPAIPEFHAGRNSIGLAPGARHVTKRWPAQCFAELGNELIKRGSTERIVLIGGPEDAETMAEFRRHFKYGEKLTDVGAAGSAAESIAAIDTCRAVVSNDSAAAHLAAARRVPVVSIFGSTSPALGFAPFRTPLKIVERDLSCRPCTHIGRKNCPRGHFDCMLGIEVAEVVRAVTELTT